MRGELAVGGSRMLWFGSWAMHQALTYVGEV